jgi:drug/metabolite transporter (DMT)-like permease
MPAFHWMNVYQPRVSAGRAALIYLLEPVFAAAFSVAWGYDALTARLFLGGSLILGGNLLIEIPYWVERWRRPPTPPPG